MSKCMCTCTCNDSTKARQSEVPKAVSQYQRKKLNCTRAGLEPAISSLHGWHSTTKPPRQLSMGTYPGICRQCKANNLINSNSVCNIFTHESSYVAIYLGISKVEVDGLGMAYVQNTVWLRGKSCYNLHVHVYVYTHECTYIHNITCVEYYRNERDKTQT